MFKLPWMWRKTHEEELERIHTDHAHFLTDLHQQIGEFIWKHGNFTAISELREAYIRHLESLVNEMQENRQ